MTRLPQFTRPLDDCLDTALVGGKAANLGRLLRAGFPVPEGFVVTTQAFRWARTRGLEPSCLSEEVAEAIFQAYRAMGCGPVAVRSSATAEDMAGASMAGLYETVLDVECEGPVLDAVQRCWASLSAPRCRAYWAEHGIDPTRVAMAVVVQRLVPAEVAGVLFTTNPHHGRQREMLLEASRGLGEALVSGQVQPDTLRLDQGTGRVLAAVIAETRARPPAGLPQQDRQPCLRGEAVHQVWELGRRIAAHFGAPQDIEWAFQGGELYVLQARPITTLQDAEAHEEVLRTTRQYLRAESAVGRGPWLVHNLAETLPHPTPLTWSIVSRFMSGSGGLGAMYRQAGFEPSGTACREGFLERIAGRVYMDAARAPEMFFADFPFAYDPAELEHSPDASQAPPTLPFGSLAARVRAGRRLKAVRARLQALADDAERELRDGLFPEIARQVAEAKQRDLRSLSVGDLIDCWQAEESRVLDTYGPRLLLPGLISEMALDELRGFLAEHFWDEDATLLAQLLSTGGPPSRTLLSDAALYEVGLGKRPLEAWLADHGHRATGEFDLAAPRWREQPERVRDLALQLAAGESPLERHRHSALAVQRQLESRRGRLTGWARAELNRHVERVRRHVTLREDAKDFLMLGYDLLRDLALEAAQRLEIGEEVFLLTREDLFDALRVGYAPLHLLRQRERIRRAEAGLSLPRLIDARSIDNLGDTARTESAPGGHAAFAVSWGEASGPARILTSPAEAVDLGRGYILVCPSTDPSWTPLFVNAAGLVLERGGMLSHGAVVARELGVPAVVLPDATSRFRPGDVLHVDGCRGWVGEASVAAGRGVQDPGNAPDHPRVAPQLVPPPPGRRDRIAARLGTVAGIGWILYLAACLVLPEPWVYRPTLAAMDLLLWPLVRAVGKPAAVAWIATGMAALLLLAQRFLTDNCRLREAKRRAARLHQMARSLPQGSARRAALLRLAAPVSARTLLAALVPVGTFLGLMVLPFIWLKDRVDPAVWNAPAGSPVQVVAMVDGEWAAPIRLEVPPPFQVDSTTPPEQALLPIRPTLERLLSLYRQPHELPGEPWELRFAPDLAREQTTNDLEAYLAAGIPPQGITWRVVPAEGWKGQCIVAVTTPGHPPVALRLALGEDELPTPSSVQGAADSPIRAVRAVYPAAQVEPVFWQPVAGVRVSWLLLYVLVYLAVVLLFRPLLGVA